MITPTATTPSKIKAKVGDLPLVSGALVFDPPAPGL
jgi:hypothetical protein